MTINWQAVTDETVRHLQALLRLDTTNPPGNEMLAVEYLAGVLKAEGIEPIVLESAPQRGNLIARLKGAGEAAPLLLYSHTDVVPAEPEHWRHPPFGGEIHDGFVWGRGAVDMKGTLAQQLMVVLLLRRLNTPLKRDVIFAATADEEVGGENSFGIAWLVKHHPDLLRAEFGLTELGGYNMEFAGATLYPIQVAEKGTVWLRVRAHGQPAHASQPRADNVVVRLARAVSDIGRYGLPYHLCDAAAGFFDAAGAAIGGNLGELLLLLKSPAQAETILNGTLKDHPLRPMLAALTHNTAVPTMLNAGYKTNVIPGVAEAVIDGRSLPGHDADSFLRELKAVMGDDLEYELINTSPPLQTSHQTPLFHLMARALKRHDHQAKVIPYMMTGATDAKYLAPLGVPSYGFAPIQLPPGFDFMNLFHAHNERAPIDGLGWGVQVLYDVVREYCIESLRH
jgi:acetylornithine deacetylase/succinyl-diaminopimelate desuccinylase-like protein